MIKNVQVKKKDSKLNGRYNGDDVIKYDETLQHTSHYIRLSACQIS